MDTPDTQMADHDWAVGALVDALSRTPFWESTRRRRGGQRAERLGARERPPDDRAPDRRPRATRAVVHTRYTTPSLLRTIELLLGVAPLGQHDAEAPAMENVFDARADALPYEALVPDVLRSTKLPLLAAKAGEHVELPRRDARVVVRGDRRFDFDDVDAAPAEAMNRALCYGLVDDRGCTTARPVMATACPVDHSFRGMGNREKRRAGADGGR